MAFQIGITPDVFWTLNPWQFSICLKAHNKKMEFDHDRSMIAMWWGARLSGVHSKKFPDLNIFLANPKKQVTGIDENAIMTRMKAYNKQVESKHGTGSKVNS